MRKNEARLIETIRKSWAWAELDPVRIYRVNAFGNVIFKERNGEYWRITPEELKAERVGKGKDVVAALEDESFLEDWRMEKTAAKAQKKLGELDEDECYAFRVWPPLCEDGYRKDNLVKRDLIDWIRASGEMAKQINDLPEGATLRIEVEE